MTHVPNDAPTMMAQSLWAKRTMGTFAALSCFLACSALAAEPTEQKPAEATAPSYKVAQSMPIDRVIQTVYANSPLNASVLRKVLVDANPKVISGNPQQRVKAGTTLVVPDHGQVVKNILAPHMAASPETPESGPSAHDPSGRRQWVRFP